MMFSYVESREEIAEAQRKLEVTIRRDFKTTKVKNIGYPGGTTFNASVRTDGTYWYWSNDHKRLGTPNPRRLNWFGLFLADVDLQISVEINVAYEGRNDSTAGFFARDNNTGAIYLLHSGRVGGGTEGIGKAAFLAWSSQHTIEVVDSRGNIREGIIVMPITGIAATQSARRYVDIIAEFKAAVRSGEMKKTDFRLRRKEFDDFYAEARGRRKGVRSSEIDYLSRHGEVVDALQRWRSVKGLPTGGRLVKSMLFDMGVAVDHDLTEIFEVKTSCNRSDIYAAIGQLMVHGSSKKCRRVVVLPVNEPLAEDLRDALRRLDIELVQFRLNARETIIS